ncbi:hypothetical protein QMK19_21065 [Streptomyces sp. H10-C2]|uniref:hypothetical protein n=1 Tax=unclassified Streptomyces TaxID=2593676 RepID=UPI0024B9DE20|nr:MULTISPECIES: hypothetical protein [unclassified Streptomyces]MDJ0344429.1 hypothetical protein [Streptomyces sp. PH10-H1]MDJ0372095.1 hypothetical protein [Streptomyces sp. H10-C2]
MLRGDPSVGQIPKDFDLTETAVRDWVKQAEVDAGERDGIAPPLPFADARSLPQHEATAGHDSRARGPTTRPMTRHRRPSDT